LKATGIAPITIIDLEGNPAGDSGPSSN